MAEKPNNKKPIHDISWYDDKYQAIVVFRNWMLLITLISIMGIFAMTMASYYFVPLKSVSPFVIQIDDKTGVVQVVESQDTEKFTENDALIKHYAYRYIVARESYNYRTFEDNYNLVRLMSLPEVSKGYRDYMLSDEGPYKKLQDGIERKVTLVSMQDPVTTQIGESTINARFEVQEFSSQRAVPTYTISVRMTVVFNKKFGLTKDERYINPLGFTVTYYGVENESKTNE